MCLAKTVVNSTRRAGLHDIEVPDFPNLKEAEIKPEYFTRDQVEELSLTARKMFEWQDMSDAIVFAAYTGMRQANLMRAQVGDIDWDMNRIGVGGRPDNPTKAGNCYWVPMSPRLEEILQRRSEGHSARALLFGNCWDDRHQLLKHFKNSATTANSVHATTGTHSVTRSPLGLRSRKVQPPLPSSQGTAT